MPIVHYHQLIDETRSLPNQWKDRRPRLGFETQLPVSGTAQYRTDLEAMQAGHFNVRLLENYRPLSELAGCRVDILYFSTAPTGTHKIIKAWYILTRDIVDWTTTTGKDSEPYYAAITSGNYGRALKFVAELVGKKVILVMDRKSPHFKSLHGSNTQVVAIDDLFEKNEVYVGPYEQWVLYPEALESKLMSLLKHENIIDITNMENIFKLLRKSQTDDSLYDPGILELRLNKPLTHSFYEKTYIPTGSGELLQSFAVQSGYDKYIFGIVPPGHPLLTGELLRRTFKKSVADKLVTPYCPIGAILKRLNRRSLMPWKGEFVIAQKATEKEFRSAYKLSKKVGLNCEPSGAAGLVIFEESFRNRYGLRFSPQEKILIVNTGNGEQG